MFGIAMPELILILIIGLVVFGPGKLPEVGKAIGRSLQEFKKATNGITDDPKVEATTKEEKKPEENRGTDTTK